MCKRGMHMYYPQELPNRLVYVLDHFASAFNKTRVRVVYGNPKTGEVSLQTKGILGMIRLVDKPFPHLELFANSRSKSGFVFPLDNILAIKCDELFLYQHPNIHLPKLEIIPLVPDIHISPEEYYQENKRVGIIHKGQCVATFPSTEKADSWIRYMNAQQNSY